MKKKIFNKILLLVVLLHLVLLVGNSARFLYRIYTELRYGVDEYYPDVDVCDKEDEHKEGDKNLLLRYRKVGKVCEED